MKRKYKDYSIEDLTKAVQTSFSAAEVMRKIGILPVGGNYRSIMRLIKINNLDISHFTGKAWNKGKSIKDSSESYSKRKGAKDFLIKERGHKCECCKNTQWLDQPIKLELHHVDGDSCNNVEENLELLCPNCHSFTENFRKPKNC